MKNLTFALLTLLVFCGCASEYEKCVEVETEKRTFTYEVAEMRAENICYEEPVNVQNSEEIIQATFKEETCIDNHIQKLLKEVERAFIKAHDICTIRIVDKDFDG